MPRRALPKILAGLALIGSIAAPSMATTVPIPRGIVNGAQTTAEYCYGTYCATYTTFKKVKIIGRLRGAQVVASATNMQFKSIQEFCSCPPSTPVLVREFTIAGTTLGGVPFAGTCSGGSIGTAFPEEGINLPLVASTCQGGTPTSQGGFTFKFLHLTSGPFVDILVEA
jgi:hypothetical protein